jgi:PEP-CTERM motif
MVMPVRYVVRGLIALTLAGMASVSKASPIVFQGIDLGASSLVTAPNSLAARNAFAAAAGALPIFDFDTHTTGLTLSPASSPQSCGFALCGGNTTAGGSQFYGAVFTTTITFASPINAFGAYFSGWQRNDQVLSYTAGSAVNLAMPAGDLGSGGMVFFGFIDAGKSITSITYSTALGDFVGIDDILFGNAAASGVPEPGSLLLLGSGIGMIGLAAWRRRRLGSTHPH